MWKRILLGVLLIIIAILSWHWKWVSYGLKQGKGQLDIIWNAKPVEVFLTDPNYPDSLKSKLALTQLVRQFAFDSLGLNPTGNYTKMYDQQGKVLLWNLSASEPYALKPYLWEYPFLGEMPYKGFFEIENARKESAILEEAGYDVSIRSVGGWSTLGILEDPILSNMLDRSDGALAELLIHELTHSTLFVKNEVEFNENLASFIGVKGAELFLRQEFGDSSEQYFSYIQENADSRLLTKIVLDGANKLDSLYGSFEDSLSKAEKDTLKWEMIKSIREDFHEAPFYKKRYNKFFDETLPNNAYFMAMRRYHNEEDSLSMIYAENHENIREMIVSLKSRYAK